VLHEDEHVRIEHSMRTPANDTVVVTFDPVMYGIEQAAFGGAFLRKAGVDVIAVRKKSEHFYQPLDRERFDELTSPILARYRRRLAYGSSLGAYAALYFCTHGMEMVIASSPRVSAHPRYGTPHWQRQIDFLHQAFDPEQPASSPAVVIYDPRDELDRTFVEHEVLPAWPHAQVLAVPYSGHPSNQFLAEIDFIAPFVRSLIADTPPPALDRRGRKSRSGMYLNVLATHCVRRAKPRWGRQLAERSLQVNPQQQLPLLTLGDAELALGNLDRAEELLRRFATLQPNDGFVLLSLRELERRRRATAPAVEPAEVAARPAAALAGVQALARTLAATGREVRSRPAREVVAAGLGRAVPAMKSLLGLRSAVSREDVVWCYQTLLGRGPESEEVIDWHLGSLSFRHLVERITRSPEFEQRVSRVAPAITAAPAPARPTGGAPRGARILVSGNCQTLGLAAALQGMTDAAEVHAVPAVDLADETLRAKLEPHAGRATLWVVSAGNRVAREMFAQAHAAGARLVTVPLIYFSAFHPDMCYAQHRQTLKPTVRPYSSLIAVWCYGHGLGVRETAALFQRDTFRALGYLDAWAPAAQALQRAFGETSLRDRFGEFWLRVKRQGCFMHTINHPKVDVLVHLARLVAGAAGLPLRRTLAPGELADGLNGIVWPLYPDVAQALALPDGGYCWKHIAAGEQIDGLEAYVENAFASYESQGLQRHDIEIRFQHTERLDRVLNGLTGR
jgi:hypothetical protein